MLGGVVLEAREVFGCHEQMLTIQREAGARSRPAPNLDGPDAPSVRSPSVYRSTGAPTREPYSVQLPS
jgi:hypothetical protein